MEANRTFNIATLIEEQKTGRFAVGLLFWCFLVMGANDAAYGVSSAFYPGRHSFKN